MLYDCAMEPPIHYVTTTDGVTIAYCEAGQGTPFVELQPPPWNNIRVEFRDWEWNRIMASRRRLIRLDLRGCGSSQRDVEDFSLDALVHDVEAVVDALALPSLVVYGEGHSVPIALAYAAAHPERASHVIVLGGFARGQDYYDQPQVKPLFSLLDQGDFEAFTDMFTLRTFGWNAADVAANMAKFARESMTLQQMQAFFAQSMHHDVTGLLSGLRVPALVLHSSGAPFPSVSTSQKLAAAIPGARFRMLESAASWTNEMEPQLLEALDEFIGDGDRQPAEKVPTHIDRVGHGGALVTLLFTDIERHTEMMTRLGDAAGRDVLREHERITREILRTHTGTEIKTMGDGFLASFTSTTRAVDCAVALQRAFADHSEQHPDLRIRVRVGLNAGEPIAEDDDLFGAAVTLAARIMAKAAGGEIFASNVVRELCAGKGHMFSDRGETDMRGFEDPVRIYEVRWREDA
jgi:class 3 adenylate cyclase